MCFSQTVSFVGGGALLAGGAYSVWKATEINPRYLPAAALPILAGIQQMFEGHVWMGLDRGDAAMVSWAALGFIAFSWLAWPVLIPFLTAILEPDKRKKRIMLMFALAGTVLGLMMFVPYVLYPDWLTVRIARGSLAYGDRMLTDTLMPRELTYLIYLIIVITPPLLSSFYHMRLFGLTTYFLLYYAYISFFCILAVAGTLHLIYIIAYNKCCQRHCPVVFR